MDYILGRVSFVVFIAAVITQIISCGSIDESRMLEYEWADNLYLNITPDDSKHVLVDVLREYLKNGTVVLEIASGSGQHITHFAQHFPQVTFQPTDFEFPPIEDIDAHINYYNLTNVREPLYLHLASQPKFWFDGEIRRRKLDYMFVANLVHATPIVLTSGLFEGAAMYLRPSGLLFMYGPFKLDGKILGGQKNVELDEKLRKRNRLWGLKDINKDLEPEAHKFGIFLDTLYELQDNNQMVVWKKSDVYYR